MSENVHSLYSSLHSSLAPSFLLLNTLSAKLTKNLSQVGRERDLKVKDVTVTVYGVFFVELRPAKGKRIFWIWIRRFVVPFISAFVTAASEASRVSFSSFGNAGILRLNLTFGVG